MRIISVEAQALSNFVAAGQRLLQHYQALLKRCAACKPGQPCLECIDALKAGSSFQANTEALITSVEHVSAVAQGKANQ